MFNKLINKIINSNKLFIIILLLPIVFCASFSRIKDNTTKTSKNNLKIDHIPTNTTEDTIIDNELTTSLNSLNDTIKDNQLNNTLNFNQTITNQTLTNQTFTNQTKINQINHLNRQPKILEDFLKQKYDLQFFFRLFIFISAFCFVIFISIFIKSLNSKSNLMYGYLDTKCGDEQHLMGKDSEYDDDDEVVMFDALDFKRESDYKRDNSDNYKKEHLFKDNFKKDYID